MSAQIICGDSPSILRKMEPESVQCCVTSPPYFGLRDYGHEGQLGLEKTPQEYVENMVSLFREVRRVLKKDGTLWLNLGDSYAADRGGTHQPAETLAGGVGGKAPNGDRVNRSRKDGYNPTRNAPAIGLKHKDLIGIPWRVAFALQSDGWYLRQDIIWHKPNPMPESVRDRCTKAHEYMFMLSKSDRYYFDSDAMKEDTSDGGGKRNRRSVWSVPTRPYRGAHFATFPPDLIRPCILAGARPSDTVLDPFGGSGTTAQVAMECGRSAILIELNPDYIPLIHERISRFLKPTEAPRQPELFV